MKILFLTDNFPPETNAPAARTYEHAVRWVASGHEVTVITGAPNFPEGKLYPGYRNRCYCADIMDGIRVVRVKTYITANEGFLKRTLDYISFMFSAFLFGLFQPRPDVVVGTSPQFFTVCAAWLLSVFRWRPFVFELRDLWPESIKAVGAMQEGFGYRMLKAVELFLYRRANRIISVTETFKQELVGQGIHPAKISVVLNGVDTEFYSPRSKNEALLIESGLEGKFVVGFLGTLGMAHALDSVLDAAAMLAKRTDIVFLLVGSGASRDALKDKAKSLDLENVVFLPRQPKSAMPSLWSLCDVSLITLKDQPLFATVIPSKIFESMGMGLPIVLSLPEGEASKVIRETKSGVVVPPENPQVLAATVRRLADDRRELRQLSKTSAAAAFAYSRNAQAAKMMKALEDTIR